jgi:hypothetical protein
MENEKPIDRHPHVILLARPEELNAGGIEPLLKENGYGLSIVGDVADLLSQLEQVNDETAIAVVDMMAVLREKEHLGEYRAFLWAYARVRRDRSVALVLVNPLRDEMPFFYGCGDLVDCYLYLPLDPHALVGWLDRLAASMRDGTLRKPPLDVGS